MNPEPHFAIWLGWWCIWSCRCCIKCDVYFSSVYLLITIGSHMKWSFQGQDQISLRFCWVIRWYMCVSNSNSNNDMPGDVTDRSWRMVRLKEGEREKKCNESDERAIRSLTFYQAVVIRNALRQLTLPYYSHSDSLNRRMHSFGVQPLHCSHVLPF